MSECRPNATDFLLRATLEANSGFNWDPLNFAFTAWLSILALLVTTAALLQDLLAAGPGRLKASKSALVSREIARIRKHRRDWILKSNNDPPETSSREERQSEVNDFGPSDANSVDQKQQSKSGTIEPTELGANPSSEEVRPAHGLQGKEEKKDDGSESPIQETKTSPIWIRLKLSYYIRHFYSRQLLPVVQIPAAL